MSLEFSLLKHQLTFLSDITTRYLALVAGFGAGKTSAFCFKAIHLASLNTGYRGLLMEPTHSMLQSVLIPEMDQILQNYGIPYKFRASPFPMYTLKFAHGSTDILLLSAENYKRLAGLNLAFFGVDEADTINKDTARSMWRMAQSRLRQGNVYQGFTTSTPEGFNFLYEYFVKDAQEGKADRRLIQARTQDNPYLPDDFIQSLRENYPPELIDAYLEGKFVNLTSGRVYHGFDRTLNGTELTLNDFPRHILHIGQDFNVNKCASVVHIIDDNIPYALDEINGAKNTEAVIEIIKHKYPNRHIMIYPDSSGKSEKTNASQTDIQLLKQAGFEVLYPSKNPFVRDRIGAMNAMFLNGLGERRYKVNVNKCPVYTQALEQQAYDKFGNPDKTHDDDHPIDGGGYFIHFRFPLKGKNSLTQY
jgi:hypothetical protein